ncbi:MAG: SGNH/GDSL hydrolase family protein [Bradymonadia bacterium]
MKRGALSGSSVLSALMILCLAQAGCDDDATVSGGNEADAGDMGGVDGGSGGMAGAGGVGEGGAGGEGATGGDVGGAGGEAGAGGMVEDTPPELMPWSDPFWEGGEMLPEPNPSIYGLFPEDWYATNIGRYNPENTAKSILALGDGISASGAFLRTHRTAPYEGSGISEGEGYIHFEKSVGAAFGRGSGWGAMQAPVVIPEAQAELATILFGTNDIINGTYTDEAYQTDLQTIIDACLAQGTMPMLMTLPPILQPNPGDFQLVDSANAIIRLLAEQNQIPLFDLGQVVADRAMLDLDLPNGRYPSEDAFLAITEAWIDFYKYVEYHALAPARDDGGLGDRVMEDSMLAWEPVFHQTFERNADLSAWEIASGDWVVENGVLVGTAEEGTEGFLLAPVSVPGRVLVEIEAEGDNELSLLVNSTSDDPVLQGYYFGFGTNERARTAINVDDTRAGLEEGLAPETGVLYTVRAWRTDNFARIGWDGQYRVSIIDPGPGGGAERDRVGAYVWSGRMSIRRITVWAAPTE